eukprot:NODE_2134_length_645_cov_7.125483_g2084_i0.p1 GENE.NODE_2134_length_645_cov_7.125483_g2084_i0~~NODE_2134_length_645_cov_7.125483_g2084_i0.p1  ORF type:complete len:152 (-),score=23.21 NODE_2134_length_645_cov_7.125483_g2084_i0:18-473(-)
MSLYCDDVFHLQALLGVSDEEKLFIVTLYLRVGHMRVSHTLKNVLVEGDFSKNLDAATNRTVYVSANEEDLRIDHRPHEKKTLVHYKGTKIHLMTNRNDKVSPYPYLDFHIIAAPHVAYGLIGVTFQPGDMEAYQRYMQPEDQALHPSCLT